MTVLLQREKRKKILIKIIFLSSSLLVKSGEMLVLPSHSEEVTNFTVRGERRERLNCEWKPNKTEGWGKTL